MDQQADQRFQAHPILWRPGKTAGGTKPLRARPQWAIWRLTWDGGRWTKPPFRCDDPAPLASLSDPAAGVHTKSRSLRQSHGDGITYMLTPEDPFAAVDIDHVRDPITGTIESWAQRLLDQAATLRRNQPFRHRLAHLGYGERQATHRNITLCDGNGLELFRRTRKPLTVTGLQLGSSRHARQYRRPDRSRLGAGPSSASRSRAKTKHRRASSMPA